ncbi:hypothetical protein [Ureibacillus aquaedulcis]|uniref:Uncharacterized protein n=1 Tax=Ureibacillus aquaedulcis TaxID=3058421 RepID=A0ABT8GQR1_9BACL|nr:hypothetical protein [Ureibacillus sp. BA0131]MDN4493589.1 hypothetical protein [Ureibacillus sp. BA0131]
MEELVTSLEEVVKNVIQFNEDLENHTDIVTQLSMFIHWYYIPTINAFGPSKYIGYKNMNTEKYDRGKRKTGVDTEKELKEWFVKLSVESEKAQELMEELYKLLEKHDKKVRSNANIHILKKGIKHSF